MHDDIRSKLSLLKPDIDGCLNWRWWSDDKGYPRQRIGRLGIRVHRYLLAITFNLDYKDRSWVAMHKCNNPYCVNIDHLVVGNHKLNMKHYSNCYKLTKEKTIPRPVLIIT